MMSIENPEAFANVYSAECSRTTITLTLMVLDHTLEVHVNVVDIIFAYHM